MRLALSFVLALFAGLVAGGGDPPAVQKHAGKTCDEILKLGHDKWFDFYTDKEGSTTVAMVAASTIYGECLAKRNADGLAKLPEADRKWIFGQHTMVRKITVDLFSLEARDGGSMYAVIAASDFVRGQELLQKMIKLGSTRGTATPAQAKRTSTLHAGALKYFGVLERQIKKERDWTRANGQSKKDHLQWLAAARAGFDKWVAQRPQNRATANLLMMEHIYDSLLPTNFSSGG